MVIFNCLLNVLSLSPHIVSTHTMIGRGQWWEWVASRPPTALTSYFALDFVVRLRFAPDLRSLLALLRLRERSVTSLPSRLNTL